MAWAINPTVTVNGVSYVSNAVGSVSINYGRTSVWEPQKPGYARITLLNTTNTAFSIDLNNSVEVKIKDYAGTTDVVIFTGVISNIENSVVYFGGTSTLTGVTLTAVAPLSVLARTQVGLVDYPAETDNDRISRIFSECGVSVASFDPAIYNYTARPASPSDALSLANYYALMATGSIYETTTGEVGYDSQYSRNLDVDVNGYFAIDPAYVNFQNLKSSTSIGELINNVNLQYNGNNYVTTSLPDSQSLYGDIQATIKTEIADTNDAQNVAGLYIAMRAYPNTSLTNIEVGLANPEVTGATIDALLNTYFGMPISLAGLPSLIYDGTYYGFVEGWALEFNQINAKITLRTSEKTYSYRPYVWEAIDPATQWDSIDPTAVKTTRTNLVTNPSMETNVDGWQNSSVNITLSQTTAAAYIGTGSMQILSNVTSQGTYALTNRIAPSDRFAAVAGDTIYIQARFKRGVGNRNARLLLNGYATATSATILEQFIGSTVTLTSGDWTLLQFTATFTNASVFYGGVGLGIMATGSINDTIYVDAVIAEKNSGGYSPYYFDGSLSDLSASRNPVLAWTGTANRSTSTANAYFSTIPITTWNNVDTVGLP